MKKRKFVYFDLGNVLINFEHQIAVDQLAALAQRDTQRVSTALFDSGLQHRYETGLVTNSEFTAEVNQRLETELDEHEILESISAIFMPNKSILTVLERVSSAGISMGILSNTCDAHWNWILKQKWSLPGKWFEFHVLSYRVQSMKPDKKIYEVCETMANCEPADIFFTDDRDENVGAAKARGWESHLFTSTQELLPALSSWIEA